MTRRTAARAAPGDACTDADAFDAPLAAWFAAQGWQPLPFQREVWRRYLAGESGLLHTPTGSGKTLAAFGGPLLEALASRHASGGSQALASSPSPGGNGVGVRGRPSEDAPRAAPAADASSPASRAALPQAGHADRARSRRAKTAEGPRILWITPLRALAADSVRALRAPIDALGLGWTVAMRTGDATARDRRLAREGRADVLVITPESLALLLSYPDSAAQFGALRGIVVDEWHELLGNKRGVLLQLCLARLRAHAPAVRTWGLSATLGNLGQARDVLLPHAPGSATVSGVAPRTLRVDTLLPDAGERFPWAGHLGLVQLERVMQRLLAVRTSVLFTNTRAQAELWHRALAAVWPEAPGTLALHHGSLDPRLRAAAEAGLRDGGIRCVVATSSLDLGVDFPAVDQVLQVGSPKGLARLLQRAGRARHRPGEAGEIVCVPTHALELAEYAAAREALAHGRIEARPPPVLALDVLAQHLVTLALGGGPGGCVRADGEDAIEPRDARNVTDAQGAMNPSALTHTLGGRSHAAHALPARARQSTRGASAGGGAELGGDEGAHDTTRAIPQAMQHEATRPDARPDPTTAPPSPRPAPPQAVGRKHARQHANTSPLRAFVEQVAHDAARWNRDTPPHANPPHKPRTPDAAPPAPSPGFDADALLAEVRGTHAYAALDDATWQAVLDFVVHGGSALAHYPEYTRVVRGGDGLYRVPDRRIAFRHRLNIGTIASDGSVAVKYLRGGGLGSVEESFVGRLRPGDRFQFAGRTLELVRMQDMTAYVRAATAVDGVVPKWQGGRMPLSTELGREVERVLARFAAGEGDPSPEIAALSPLLALQQRLSALPGPDHLLCEWIAARGGWHLFLYPFAGRAVHDGLGALLALRWGRQSPNTFSLATNDYGLVLSLARDAAPDAALVRALLSPERLHADLRDSLNLGELARRQFREVARVAGLLPPSLPGRAARSLRQLQASSGLLFDVLQRHDPGHLLLAQAEREVFAGQLDVARLADTLRDCAQRRLSLHVPGTFTPFSFPLWAESLRSQHSSEDWRARVERAAAQLERRFARTPRKPRAPGNAGKTARAGKPGPTRA